MESVAKGLVGREVDLVMRKKPEYPSFSRRYVIMSVADGMLEVKGPSGMVKTISLEDPHMKVEEIRAVIPESSGV